MSSCLSGGGRAYRLDLEIIKSPCSSWTSNSSSPSSTLSETSNSPLAISTRKPRTPRKRPNQTYNEAAALLSTAYPKIFSTKHLTKPCKFTKQQYPFSYESTDLLLPFRTIDDSCFLIHHHHRPPVFEKSINIPNRQKQVSSCQSPREINSKVNNNNDNNSCSLENFDDFQQDFDAESILDEEIEEGIDSILGDINVKKESDAEANDDNNNNNNNNSLYCSSSSLSSSQLGTCYGYPVGLGFGINYFDEYYGGGYGMRKNSISAFRRVDDGEWWRYPSVNIGDITPKFNKPVVVSEKKKKKKVEAKNSSVPASSSRTSKENSEQKPPPQSAVAAAAAGGGGGGGGGVNKEESLPKSNFAALLLKLDYDEILNAWSDRSCPISDDSPVSEAAGNDIHGRLGKIDLFSESGGIREASVMRYKEKRRTRLFSKKIRYQVRKVNADRRPRMKGRFVRRSNSPESEQG